MDRLYMITDRFFESMLRGYRNSLHWVLDNPGLTLVVLFLTIALNIAIVIKIPKGFFPAAGYRRARWRSTRPTGFLLPSDE